MFVYSSFARNQLPSKFRWNFPSVVQWITISTTITTTYTTVANPVQKRLWRLPLFHLTVEFSRRGWEDRNFFVSLNGVENRAEWYSRRGIEIIGNIINPEEREREKRGRNVARSRGWEMSGAGRWQVPPRDQFVMRYLLRRRRQRRRWRRWRRKAISDVPATTMRLTNNVPALN